MQHKHMNIGRRRPVVASFLRPLALLAAVAVAPSLASAQSPDTGAGSSGSGLVAVRTPEHADGRRILRMADAHDGRKILVSTEQRRLWLINGADTVMSVPVAIGMGRSFEFEGRRFWFETPRSKRSVLRKQESPLWNVPEWHYLERAKHQDLQVVDLTREDKILLEDGTFILTIGNDVGRLNHFGNFWPFTPGNEIIFDGKVYVPPKGTNQRLVPDALGPYKLDTGDGYLIHGTHIYNEDSIGEAVSHGCVRMRNEDLERLYERVPVGTAVYIF